MRYTIIDAYVVLDNLNDCVMDYFDNFDEAFDYADQLEHEEAEDET